MVVQHHAQCRHQGRVVLQWLAHAHHHHVADGALAGRQRQLGAQGVFGVPQLGQDFTRAQVAAEALVPGGAETAPHRATGLRRDAKRAAVVFRDEHSLDRVAAAYVEQPLDGAVGRLVFAEDGQRPHVAAAHQLAAQGLGQVRHAIEIALAFLVDPAKQLHRAVALLAQLRAEHRQPVEVEVEQVDSGHGAMGQAGLVCRQRL